ncbi:MULTISPECIES: SpoIIE family protein phosphatase [Streptomyces]|uniref:SpoIIE family protein phosphatase n=3 Tax=Streptomyces rimosus TaxID=1927 RepID=A0A8A1V0H5_STRR1|nr:MULTISPECIES: SpoIIE family protein phosphatase [Streptomyces]QDA02511.1 ANTAR domain-containing protein [Streptomyces rimosus]QEV73782.1 ANTAR domain-containing protein [Streptomyces rimosus]QGY69066.1 SpoIIE family protein phosphatase [Streptomyces rimosus R6-500]QST85479.1 SpoIIE family protein phosphatase [Streptomyces rimosus subsp. rimosus ATCC 10970]QTL84736.1 SpoIIE family protein phosphatase [Streptomyces rimosus subsp. rimosus]
MSPFEHVGTPSGDDGSPASEDGPGRGPSVPGGLPVPSGPERGPASSGARPDRTSAVGRLAATVERLRSEVQAAHAAADGRALIELAKGIMVERLRCGPAQATRQLAELAEKAAVSQLELAVDIINQAARDRVAEIAGDFLHRTRTEPAGTGPADAACATVGVRLRTAESAALAAGDAQAVADSLLQHALSPLGATAVAIWTAGSDTSLTLAGHAGFPADEAVRWRYVPPGVVTVARQALTERDTVRFASLSETGIPSIGRTHHPHGGRVALPAGTGGRIHGVLEICWQQPLPPQPPVIMRQIEALAELCAHALETAPASYGHGPTPAQRVPAVAELVDLADGLHDPALVLTPHLGPDGELTDFRIHHANGRFMDPAGRPRSTVNGALLLEAYPMAADESELFDKVQRVYATGEPFRAQRMTLTALVDQVPLAAVADISVSRHGDSVLLIWRIEDEAARLASLLQHAQRLGRIGGFEENLLTDEITWNGQLFALYGRPPTGTPVSLRDLAAHAHPDDGIAIGRFLRAVLHHQRSASAAFRLQRRDGVTRHIRVIAEPVHDADGSLLAVRGAYQDISAQHWTEVALAATRDQLAHTEQESAERNRLALQLQQAIMPPTRGPIAAPGLQIAVRYRPAETESLVGGDWYDAVVLPSRRVLLCVGDIAGHGIEAATGMVVLRNALRGLAITGAGPAQLLSWLNIVAHHLTDQVTATAVCGLYDPETRTLRWARAGHLPPVLVRGREATRLPLVGGLLLGAVAQAAYEEAELQLEADDTLLMYTDGLVERRDTAIHDSLAQLLATAQSPAATLEHRLDQLLTHSKSDTDDDTCLVGIQVV